MKKYIVYVLLGTITVSCAILEAYLELPTQVVQASGALNLLCVVPLVAWAMSPGESETPGD